MQDFRKKQIGEHQAIIRRYLPFLSQPLRRMSWGLKAGSLTDSPTAGGKNA